MKGLANTSRRELPCAAWTLPAAHFVRFVAILLLVGLPSHAETAEAPSKSPPSSYLDGLAAYRGHPFSLFMLHNEAVAKELGLSAKQNADVHALIKQYARETRDKIRSMKGLLVSARKDPDGPGKKALQDLSATLNDASDRYDAKSLQLIDTQQRGRLEQLKFQSRGLLLFLDPGVCKELAITSAQNEQILKNHSECNQKTAEIGVLVKSRKMAGNEGVKAVYALRREARDRTVSLLTPAQRVTLDKMLGPKPSFEPSELVLREVLDP